MAYNYNLDEIKNKLKSIRFEFLVLNAALILLGILMVCFPIGFNSIICLAVGIGLCIWGIVRVISYFRLPKENVFGSFGLVQGGAMIGFGIYFLVNPELFIQIIGVSLAIILLVTAVVKFQYAFDFLKIGANYWWVHLIGAVIMLICGILALTKPFGIANIIMIFIGFSLIFSSIWDIITVLKISNILKKGVKNAKSKSKYVDVDVEDDNE